MNWQEKMVTALHSKVGVLRAGVSFILVMKAAGMDVQTQHLLQ
jgi:hypothetical protein